MMEIGDKVSAYPNGELRGRGVIKDILIESYFFGLFKRIVKIKVHITSVPREFGRYFPELLLDPEEVMPMTT